LRRLSLPLTFPDGQFAALAFQQKAFGPLMAFRCAEARLPFLPFPKAAPSLKALGFLLGFLPLWKLSQSLQKGKAFSAFFFPAEAKLRSFALLRAFWPDGCALRFSAEQEASRTARSFSRKAFPFPFPLKGKPSFIQWKAFIRL
jgi:hypothetical protein